LGTSRKAGVIGSNPVAGTTFSLVAALCGYFSLENSKNIPKIFQKV
jgi:hypothetical protein